jgi:IS1 family transposase
MNIRTGFRNLKSKRIQCDEIWSFVYAKDKNCTRELKAKGAGSVWTWVALDADSKLVPCWFIGPRHAGCAYHFLADLKDRLANRVQLTTDGHKAYLDATERAFGTEIDYAMLEKIYGAPQDTPETRSPAICMGARKAVITGNPVHEHISTSYVERQNLTMRMSMRRFTRLTNGFSKKVENHGHAIAIHYMYYNFCAYPSIAPRHTRDGGWRFESCFVGGRNNCLARLTARAKIYLWTLHVLGIKYAPR